MKQSCYVVKLIGLLPCRHTNVLGLCPGSSSMYYWSLFIKSDNISIFISRIPKTRGKRGHCLTITASIHQKAFKPFLYNLVITWLDIIELQYQPQMNKSIHNHQQSVCWLEPGRVQSKRWAGITSSIGYIYLNHSFPELDWLNGVLWMSVVSVPASPAYYALTGWAALDVCGERVSVSRVLRANGLGCSGCLWWACQRLPRTTC